MSVEEERPRIGEFYRDKSIFVTGFSGFLGKLLVEKILWSCPQFKNIYVLLRNQRGLNPQQRFQKIIDSELYTRVREHRMEELNKIVLLEGDVTIPEMGLTSEIRARLCEEVDFVFHCAASVKFDDPLTRAIEINVKGTKAVIELALKMKKLTAFIHVSTAYTNSDKFDIEEKLYPAHADWRKTLEIYEKGDHEILNTLSKKYMNHLPNTYVFAKSIGEHLVCDHADRLPVVIFRPSIVTATLEEPFSGWVDNLNGPSGLAMGTGTGVMRTCLIDTNILPDFMPADIAIRGLMFTAYARVYNRAKGVHLYNWCSDERSITYDFLLTTGYQVLEAAPFKYAIWTPSIYLTTSRLLFYLHFIIFQAIPAIFVDSILRLFRREPIILKIQRKIFMAMTALSYFMLNYFHFHNENAVNLVNYIKDEDFTEFSYLRNPSKQEHYMYLLKTTQFMQRKYFKMTAQDANLAKTIGLTLKVVDRVVKISFLIYVGMIIYSYQLIPRLLNSILQFLLNF